METNIRHVSMIAMTIKRTTTNEGEKCKQYFRILGAPMKDSALAITKLVLTERNELYEKYGYRFIREWKGKAVYMQIFSIKLETLSEVVKWISEI